MLCFINFLGLKIMSDLLATAPDLSADDYVVVGLATCFTRTEDGVAEVQIVEPIPASALEALFKGIPTSYSQAVGITIGQALAEPLQIPAGWPSAAQLADEFVDRTIAATRTFKRRQEATVHIPLGTAYDGFQYSIERKRVLNASRNVTKDDNVKQHAYTHQKL
jgi:hypothetical protein